MKDTIEDALRENAELISRQVDEIDRLRRDNKDKAEQLKLNTDTIMDLVAQLREDGKTLGLCANALRTQQATIVRLTAAVNRYNEIFGGTVKDSSKNLPN